MLSGNNFFLSCDHSNHLWFFNKNLVKNDNVAVSARLLYIEKSRTDNGGLYSCYEKTDQHNIQLLQKIQVVVVGKNE